MTPRGRGLMALALVVFATAAMIGSCGNDSDAPVGEPTDPADALSDADVRDAVPADTTSDDSHDVPEADSGPSDAASDGDAAGPSCVEQGVPPWLLDPALWKSVPATSFTQPRCTVTEADAATLPVPALTWEACGPGCESTDPNVGLGSIAFLPRFFIAGDEGHHELYLTSEYDMKCSTTRVLNLLRLVRMGDGLTIGAVKFDQESTATVPPPCEYQFDGTAFAVLFGGGGQFVETYARFPLDGGSVTWASPPVPYGNEPGTQIFEIDYQGGSFFAVGGMVAIADDPSSNTWRVLESPSGSVYGASEGDLAVWTDQAKPGVRQIRGWAPDGKGVRDIVVGLTEQTKNVVVSWERIVGFAGDLDYHGFFTRLRIWTSPRAYDVSQAQVTTSPDLVEGLLAVASLYIVTSGDYVMASVTNVDSNGDWVGSSWFLIVNLNTFDAWRLDPPPGRAWTTRALALTHSHLYVADNDGGDAESTLARSIYRFDLSQISAWAKPLPPP